MVGKLEDKVKMYKRLAENAEEMASNNLAKLRTAQVVCEEECFFSSMFIYIKISPSPISVQIQYKKVNLHEDSRLPFSVSCFCNPPSPLLLLVQAPAVFPILWNPVAP